MKENSISVEGKLAEIFKKLSKGDTMDEVIVIFILFTPLFFYFYYLNVDSISCNYLHENIIFE